ALILALALFINPKSIFHAVIVGALGTFYFDEKIKIRWRWAFKFALYLALFFIILTAFHCLMRGISFKNVIHDIGKIFNVGFGDTQPKRFKMQTYRNVILPYLDYWIFILIG